MAIPIPDQKARERILRVLVSGMRLAPRGPSFPPASPSTSTPGTITEEAGAGGAGAAVGMDVVGEGHASSTGSSASDSGEEVVQRCRGLYFNPLDLTAVAKKTPGFVGADLMSLAKEAAMLAVERLSLRLGLLAPIALLGDGENETAILPPRMGAPAASTSQSDSAGGSSSESSHSSNPGHVSAEEDPQTTSSASASTSSLSSQLPPLQRANDRSTGNRSSGHLPPDALTDLYVTEADFMAATKLVQPTAKREGFAMAPDVSWDDIGALAGVRDELSLSVSASDWL